MAIGLKVLNGTRSLHAPRLCDSCVSGVIRRGASESDEHVFCTATRRNVDIRVVECNIYRNRSHPPLWALKEIAWVLQTDSRRERIGFIKAKEWERKHENDDLLPGHLD
jgi:hypothetical protein